VHEEPFPIARVGNLVQDNSMSSHIEEQLNLAKQACDLGNLEAAECCYETALAEVEASGELASLATVLYEAQRFYSSIGDKEKARLLARRFRLVAVHYCHKQEITRPH
jgi:hypothetical protein